jgi:hypothetical protein
MSPRRQAELQKERVTKARYAGGRQARRKSTANLARSATERVYYDERSEFPARSAGASTPHGHDESAETRPTAKLAIASATEARSSIRSRRRSQCRSACVIREYGRVVAKIPEIIEQNEPQSQCADNAMILRARHARRHGQEQRTIRGMIVASDFPTRSATCRRNVPLPARSSSHPA